MRLPRTPRMSGECEFRQASSCIRVWTASNPLFLSPAASRALIRHCVRLPGGWRGSLAPRVAPADDLLRKLTGQGRLRSRLAAGNAEGHIEREEPP
jgi:hypothetical protein